LMAVPMLLAVHTSQLNPEPYMDEIFHVPQACEVLEHPTLPSAHPLITTPPGLYYASLLLTGFSSCDTVTLRSVSSHICGSKPMLTSRGRLTSALYYIGCGLLLWRLLQVRGASSAGLLALAAVTFPPLLFCSQLFYTDTGALFFLLLAWVTVDTGPAVSAAAALMCMFFRQSNIVWVAFILGERASFYLEEACGTHLVWKRDPRVWLRNVRWGALLASMAPLAASLAVFLAYLLSRGSLVLGDRDNHVVALHLAQLNYASFTLLATSPLGYRFALAPLRETRAVVAQRPLTTLALCVQSALFAARFSVTHPFLLADNRHFSFYVWNRFFLRHWAAKLAPVPVYALASARLVAFLEPRLQSAGFVAACALSLAPLPLFEPRYFIVPVAVFAVIAGPRLGGNDAVTAARLCVGANVLVSAWVQYMFWYRPFTGADGKLARFMW